MRDVGSEKDEDEMTDKHMTTVSQHYFVDESDKSSFSIAIIELGAGTSLPGLVAAKVGSNVTLTDDSNRIEVMGLTWGFLDASIFDLNPNIILGADVFYDASAFDDLFATITYLLQSSPGSVFITTYHNRSGHHLIEFLMVKWGLKCVKLVDGFSFLPHYKARELNGNIQLAEIVLNHESPEDDFCMSWTVRYVIFECMRVSEEIRC
ncbi:putative methyltransferase family protein [Citrus sinensis]|nr:putative methyltransferase family protein [Citrus sinensis]